MPQFQHRQRFCPNVCISQSQNYRRRAPKLWSQPRVPASHHASECLLSLQHAQGAMQADAAGGGDLQALFDTSALVLGIALVVLDPQVMTLTN